jgi:hypothetical protein
MAVQPLVVRVPPGEKDKRLLGHIFWHNFSGDKIDFHI